jgi:purine-binding chemotaxis protein CheW
MDEIKAIGTSDNASDTVQYIVVKIGNEQYGINIQYIDNIVRNQRITRVPKAQRYFKGVINLRGEIIPVMSVRLKLGLADDEYDDKTRIIIVKIESASVGVIVDQVKEVVTLGHDDIEKVNRTAIDDVASGYINAIGKSNNELISLLDIVSLIEEA